MKLRLSLYVASLLLFLVGALAVAYLLVDHERVQADLTLAQTATGDLDAVRAVATRAGLESHETQLVLERVLRHSGRIAQHAAERERFTALAAVALLLLGGGCFIGARRYLMTPVFAIERALRRLVSGEADVRARLDGPPELKRLAALVNEMAVRVSAQRDEQLRFLATVAHEIKNPLAAIEMSIDALKPEAPFNESERRDVLDIIERQVRRLHSMVGDLLDTSQAEAGRLRLRLERVDLNIVVQDAVLLFTKATTRHRLAATLAPNPVHCRLDAVRIGQVLNNLLSNAIKYSPSGGTIQVRVDVHREMARVIVKDEGVGMSGSDLRRAFNAFYRSVSTRDSVPGVGLGLSVVKKIVEAHAGTIQAESEIGCGSTFILTLPLFQEAPPSLTRPDMVATNQNQVNARATLA